MSDYTTAPEVFAAALKKLASTFPDFRKRGVDEPSVQAIEAIRKKQEEHEERKRLISESIASGARISRSR
jgi:hypothetical protein